MIAKIGLSLTFRSLNLSIMTSEKDYLRSYNMLDLPKEMKSIISDFPEEFNIEIEDEYYNINDMSGTIEGIIQEYNIGLNDAEISSQIFIYNTIADAEEILKHHNTIGKKEYRNALEKRNPAGQTRILYFVPEGKPYKPSEYDIEELELIERFNNELEFLSMADGKDSFGGNYMHVFDLNN